jgi:hypothetical protein
VWVDPGTADERGLRRAVVWHTFAD